ncbi:hypothetical protein VTN31DRAFT_2170 [Thermomyces dupontii]|uniref:uncharacterized protein n=1 Tax=Talaromyces thermophilus TaxID=28565 RepID=UPI0037426EE2
MTVFRGHFPPKAAIPLDNPDLLHLERPLKQEPEGLSPHKSSDPDAAMAGIAGSTAEIPCPGGKETSLFRKMITRKHRTAAWDGLSSRVRRSFSHRRPSALARDKAVRTPDLVSEQGYDSDAHCISTPSLSDQGQSTTSMVKETMVKDGMEGSVVSTGLSDTATIAHPPAREITHASAPPSPLVVSKRRGPKTSSPRSHRFSLETAYLRWKHGDVKKDHSRRTLRKDTNAHKSKFTEMFGLEATGPAMLAQKSQTPTELRRVSVGWMSEGRRLGYGYSFVDNDDENGAPESDKADDENQDALGTSSSRTGSPSAGRVSENKEPDHHSHNRPATPMSLWSRFPACTREERNASASFEDGIIARDFCTKATPEWPASINSANDNGGVAVPAQNNRQGYQHGKWRFMGLRRTGRGTVP